MVGNGGTLNTSVTCSQKNKLSGVRSGDQGAQVIGLLSSSPSMGTVYPRSPELQRENAEVEITWH
jgi:hypothetical protein